MRTVLLVCVLVLIPALCQAQRGFSGRGVQAQGQGPSEAKTVEQLKEAALAAKADLDAAMAGKIYGMQKAADETAPGERYFPAEFKKKKPARYVFTTAKAKKAAIEKKRDAFDRLSAEFIREVEDAELYAKLKKKPAPKAKEGQ